METNILTHFIPQEFVPRHIFDVMGSECLCLINPVILVTCEDIRKYFDKPVTLNNWHIGGQFEFRGFRPAYCSEGADMSMHRVGGAQDCDVKGLTAQEVRTEIIKHSDKFPYITRLEDNVTWVHFDCKKTGLGKIQLFKV